MLGLCVALGGRFWMKCEPAPRESIAMHIVHRMVHKVTVE